ncbi:MAG: AraC family transcriptional regulator [Clostridia bacterium]|nr:AraC family transcriptional regulator [Clostridia bacterium]
MKDSEKIAAVSRMQLYIESHVGEKITLDALCDAAGYSKYHASRMFKELTGMTAFETIRALRLTRAARALLSRGDSVLDIALENGYDSHDGFTRAFSRLFKITPKRYGRETPPIRYYIPYNIGSYYHAREDTAMEHVNISKVVTVTQMERPARKLILLRARKTTGGDYFAFCEEMGCDWEGLLNSIPERFTDAALLTLHQTMVKPGTSDTAAGVEVPHTYAKPIPDGFEIIKLPPCRILFFQGAKYENEDDFCIAIDIVQEALSDYDPSFYGWTYAPELAPSFNFGSSAALGARAAVAVINETEPI